MRRKAILNSLAIQGKKGKLYLTAQCGFNVIKGQMSLVGPRMVTPEELELYGALKEERICFKPGITGYWQVNGRQEIDYNERIRMDMFYVRHWNIWLDIKILFKTVLKVIRMEGAY